ncbi:hypothetical protein EVAR_70823_1 [Eumeta japonica]|uniref:Uncharacterized protein n=1 Tax=Eumeta variegata TaxID=151549 RepID=A0A4C2AF94_EUMVA|nr:hypothetical protein EVAR_70823_1 [Eumeta japonica]
MVSRALGRAGPTSPPAHVISNRVLVSANINPSSLLLPFMLKGGRSTKIGIETGIEIRSGAGLAPTVEPDLTTRMWPRSRLKLTAKSADVEHEGIHRT